MLKRSIIPSILTDSRDEIKQKVEKLQGIQGKVEGLKRISIDIIDGLFADNLTVMPADLEEMRFGELEVEMQLMTEEPVDLLGEAFQLGVKRVYGHIEKMGNREEFLAIATEMKMEVGFGLDLFTPIDELTTKELLKADGILLMSVKAGFSGQKFDRRVLEKIAALRAKGYEGDIVIDGGLNTETIPLCLEAGANQFAVTSFLWQAENTLSRYTELTHLLKE